MCENILKAIDKHYHFRKSDDSRLGVDTVPCDLKFIKHFQIIRINGSTFEKLAFPQIATIERNGLF